MGLADGIGREVGMSFVAVDFPNIRNVGDGKIEDG